MDFFVLLHAEEEGRCIEDADIAVFLDHFVEVLEDFRILAVRVDVFVFVFVTGIGQFLADRFEIDRSQALARAFRKGFLAFQDDLLEFFREALIRDTDAAFKEFDDRLREVEDVAFIVNILFRQVVLDHEQGHVADYFRRRRNFDDVAEHHADRVVHLLDFVPAVAEADGFGLLAQVGELAARHFMLVDFRVRIRIGFVDALIVRTDSSPVTGHFFHGIDVEVGLAVLAAQSVVQGAHARLARAAGKGGISDVDDVDTGVDGAVIRADGVARTVVRMEMDRQVDGIFQGRYQAVSGFRFQEAGHILDGDDIGAGILQFLGHVDIVFQIVFIAGRVEDIASVAEGDFGELVVFADGLDRAIHVVQAVEAVEDAEDVDAVLGRQVDEVLDDVVGIACIADGIGTADEHLQEDVRRFLAHLAQADPRVFIEEAVGYVESSAAPAFIGEEVRQFLGSCFQDAEHIDGTDACRKQGLMGVTHGRIGKENFLLVFDPLGEFFRSHGIEFLLRPIRIRAGNRRRQFQGFKFRFVLMAGVGITVDGRIANVFEELRAAVLDDGQVEQFRMVVDEVDVIRTGDEFRTLEDVDQEADVGLDAADTEFLEDAEHLFSCFLMGPAISRRLDQQRIVVRRDDGAGVGIAAVEADAKAAAAAVYHDLARIRHEVVHRVFRRDTALDGVAQAADVVLGLDADFVAVEGVAFGDFDLGLDDVNARDHFRNGMFDLYARVDFDEVEFAVRRNQEFDRPGVDVMDVLHQFQGSVADFLTQFDRQGRSRSRFDDFLMTALDGAVPFKEMDDIAVFVAHDLDFDVFRIDDAFFQINFIVAKSQFGFRFGAVVGIAEISHAVDHTHTAAAAAVDSFQHDREADLFSEFFDFCIIHDRAVAARDVLDTGLLRLDTGIDLIAEHDEVFNFRTDEDNAFFFTAFGQVRIFRQEAVARMDGIDVMFMSNADNIFNV